MAWWCKNSIGSVILGRAGQNCRLRFSSFRWQITITTTHTFHFLFRLRPRSARQHYRRAFSNYIRRWCAQTISTAHWPLHLIPLGILARSTALYLPVITWILFFCQTAHGSRFLVERAAGDAARRNSSGKVVRETRPAQPSLNSERGALERGIRLPRGGWTHARNVIGTPGVPASVAQISTLFSVPLLLFF